MGILDRFRSVQLDDIAEARQAYLEIAAASAQRSRDASEGFLSEAILRLPAGSGFVLDCLRLDYAATSGREVCIGYFHTRAAKLGGILKDGRFGTVSVSGFDWAGTRFEVSGPVQVSAPLSDWAKVWMKDPGPEASAASIRELRGLIKDQDPGSAGLGPEPADAIHAVRVFDEASFAVDFGSAPLAAFTELLESLDRAGAFEIRVSVERQREEIFHDDVVDILEQRHRADLEERSRRDLPGEFRAWFASSAEAMAAEAREDDPEALAKVRKEIEAQLAEIDDRIVCTLDLEDPAALHLRFGSDGWLDVVPEIRKLTDGWTAPAGWRISAFQPPQPWQSVKVAAPLRFGASAEIDPEKVRATVTPRPCDVDVALQIEDFGRFTSEGLQTAARQLLFEVLGEEAYLSAVGSVTAHMAREDGSAGVALAELPSAFDRSVAETRRRMDELEPIQGQARIDMNLALVLDRLTEFQQVQADYAAVRRQHPDTEEIDLGLVFWVDDEAQERALEAAFGDFELCTQDALSLRGSGSLVSLGACDDEIPVENFRGWLEIRLMPALNAGALLVDLRPQLGWEAIAAADEMAKVLMNAGDYGRAARILRPATLCHLALTEGRMHSKLGLCHFDTKDYPEAIDTLGQALDLLDDEETCFKGESYTNMGACLDILGQVETALPYYLEALEFDSQIATRHYNIGQAYAKLGKAEAACRALATALDLDASIIDMIREDSDLEAFRETPEFKAMIDGRD